MQHLDEDLVMELTGSLVAMGFTQQQAIKALKRTNYDLGAATDLLIAGDGGVHGSDVDDDSEVALPRETMDNLAHEDIPSEIERTEHSFRLSGIREHSIIEGTDEESIDVYGLARRGKAAKLRRYLLEEREHVVDPALFRSAIEGRQLAVAIMLLAEFGYTPDLDLGAQGFPLHVACKSRALDIAGYLLTYGPVAACVNRHANSSRGELPMGIASGRDHVEMVKLLQPFVDVSVANKAGERPFHVAVRSNSATVVSYLLKHFPREVLVGPDFYPVWEAAAHASVDTLPILLKEGFDATAGVGGETPLDVAMKEGNAEIIAILRDHLGSNGTK